MKTEAYLNYIPTYSALKDKTENVVATLVLNHPKNSNAFDLKLISSISKMLDEIRENPLVRVLVIQGKGRHFCSGADLRWMNNAETLSPEDNIKDIEAMSDMFDRLYELPIPTISIPKGITYGGGLGFVACSDIAICSDRVRFCLSESSIGLLPAVILPYLYQKVNISMLRRYVLTSEHFGFKEAFEMGLIHNFSNDKSLESSLHSVVNSLLSSSPESLREFKKLEKIMRKNNNMQSKHNIESISQIRQSNMGMLGIKSAIEKKVTPWSCFIKSDSCILV